MKIMWTTQTAIILASVIAAFAGHFVVAVVSLSGLAIFQQIRFTINVSKTEKNEQLLQVYQKMYFKRLREAVFGTK